MEGDQTQTPAHDDEDLDDYFDNLATDDPRPPTIPRDDEMENVTNIASLNDNIRAIQNDMAVGAVTTNDINEELKGMDREQHDGSFETEVIAMMTHLGADPKSFRREKQAATTRIVMEVYSPPRVTGILREMADKRYNTRACDGHHHPRFR